MHCYASSSRSKFSFAVVLVVLLVASTILGQDAQEHSRLGLSLAKEGRLLEAEQELLKAARAAPGVALPRAQLASVLGLQGKWKEALENFQKAVELDPTNLNFRRETAAVQYQLRETAAAEKNLRYVLERQPDDRGATLLLGLVSEARGDYATAARLLGAQFELAMSQPDRTVALFHAQSQSGQHSGLPKILSALRVRANDPMWIEAIVRCTQIAAVSGDVETAESLLALVPANPAAGFEVAKLRYNNGNVDGARQLLTQLAGTVDNANVQSMLGRCYQTLHQPELALRAYERAVELDQSNPDRYEDLIFLQLELNQTDAASRLADRLISTAPRDAKSWIVKANTEIRINAFQDALKSFARAGELDPSSADAALGVASIHALSGATNSAMADYKSGIQKFPGDARFFVAYAAALLASPEAPASYARVESLLLQAVKLDSHSPDAHYQLAQLALKQGQLNKAKVEFLEAIRIDPNRSSAHFGLSLTYRRLGQADEAAQQFAMYEKLKQSKEPSQP